MGLGLGDAMRLSFKNLRRRSALPLLLALIIPSASIAVPLTMGSSFQESLRQDIYDRLGEVDEVVRSQGVMRMAIYDALAGDPVLAVLTDGLAPALILPGTLTGPSGDRRDTQLDLVGIDGRSGAFGDFWDAQGRTLPHDIAPGEVYLREDGARRTGAAAGDRVRALVKDPAFSLESVYSNGSSTHSLAMSVASVVKREGLGALNLVPRGADRRTAFVNLSWLMEGTGQDGINAILVSNNGDSRSGIAGTEEVSDRLRTLLEGEVGYEEGGFLLTAVPGYVKLESRKIFFDERFAAKVGATDSRVGSVSRETSYFVNMIMGNGSWIPYSTVTAFDPAGDAPFGSFIDNSTGLCITGEIGSDEIILTTYAAGRLGAGVGDEVTLNYTVYDSSFRENLRYERFRVKYIVALEGKANDSELMPPFPGIKGKASCYDWSPPIPVDRSIMDSEVLYYWQSYGGTPKAYIHLSTGTRLWGNDLGNITTVKAMPVPGVSPGELAVVLGEKLNASLTAGEMGVFVENVKRDAIDSVAGLFIVTEALIAFGTAVTASGMVLIYIVVIANIESRRREIGILRSLGITRRGVSRLFTIEGVALSLAGSALGLLAGILFAWLGVWASNNLWTGILPMDSSLHPPGPDLLFAGFLSGFGASVLAFYAGARAAARGSVVSNIRGLPESGPGTPAGPDGGDSVEERGGATGRIPRRKARGKAALAALGMTLAAAGLALRLLPTEDSSLPPGTADALLLLGPPLLLTFAPGARKGWQLLGYLLSLLWLAGFSYGLSGAAGEMLLLYYFLAGDLLLLLTGFIVYERLDGIALMLSGKARLGRIPLANASRNRRRTAAYVTVYALVVFPLLTLSAYIPMQAGSISRESELRGGGYDILGSSELPLYFDLGNAAERAGHNLTGFPSVSVVQFLSYGSPGGTCSNLNTKAPPRILAANATFTSSSKIPVAESIDGSRGSEAWELLERDGGRTGAAPGSVVPAIGDYTTIIWIFGKGLDGTIGITDEFGNPVKLRIVAILHDSIFQGSVFVSETAMKRLYPTLSQYNLFLFKTTGDEGGVVARPGVEEVAAALESSLSAYAFGARPVKDIVADFIKVDLTYVSMLQAMLASGVIIGTLGFAAKVARETLERRYELGVMRALGFRKGQLAGLLLWENVLIFLLGFGIALATAIASSFIFLKGLPSPLDTLLVLGLLLAVIALSTIVPARRFSSASVAGTLRMPE